MNKNQFRAARLQLGLSLDGMGRALGVRKGTIAAMETGARPIGDGVRYASDAMHLTHIVSFAVAWMLFNGGAFIPWTREEDRQKLCSFRDYHGMTNSELAALFDVSIREMEYCVSPSSDIALNKMRQMALAWMRIFGSRDPFAFPLQPNIDADSASTCPMRLDPAPTRDGRIIDHA